MILDLVNVVCDFFDWIFKFIDPPCKICYPPKKTDWSELLLKYSKFLFWHLPILIILLVIFPSVYTIIYTVVGVYAFKALK